MKRKKMIRLSSVIEVEITCVARVALRERKVPRNISDASPLSPSSPGILIASRRFSFHRVINNRRRRYFQTRYVTNSHERCKKLTMINTAPIPMAPNKAVTTLSTFLPIVGQRFESSINFAPMNCYHDRVTRFSGT